MNEAAYKKLLCWQAADQLVHAVYDDSMRFPKEEIYGLTSQLKRAALSVPANIVEGQARNTRNEFHHFLSISLGSLAEVEYYLEFAFKRQYLTKEEFSRLQTLRARCGQLLWSLFKSKERNT